MKTAIVLDCAASIYLNYVEAAFFCSPSQFLFSKSKKSTQMYE